MSIHDHHIYTDLLSIGYVDLTNIKLATKEDRRYNVDKWARLFKCKTREDIRMLAKEDTAILEATETICEISEDERLRRQMEAREDYYRRQRTISKQFEKLEQALADQKKELADQAAVIADQATVISDKDAEIADKDAEIARKTKKSRSFVRSKAGWTSKLVRPAHCSRE